MAVKLIRGVFASNYNARKVLREVSLHSQLSAMKGNVFSAKLLDIVIPGLKMESSPDEVPEEVESPLPDVTPSFGDEKDYEVPIEPKSPNFKLNHKMRKFYENRLKAGGSTASAGLKVLKFESTK